MTAQDVINLELLYRATDPRISVEERSRLQETLGYALLRDESGGQLLLQAVQSLEGQPIPEEMLLWLLDWLESQPVQNRPDETAFVLARFLKSTVGELGRTRLLDVISTLSSESGEPLEHSAIESAVYQEFSAAIHDETDGSLLVAVDLALTGRDSRLLIAIASTLRTSQEFQRLAPAVHARIAMRLPMLSREMRANVVREFPGLGSDDAF
jgi:hypothetical protein